MKHYLIAVTVLIALMGTVAVVLDFPFWLCIALGYICSAIAVRYQAWKEGL